MRFIFSTTHQHRIFQEDPPPLDLLDELREETCEHPYYGYVLSMLHQYVDDRSLELHQAISKKIRHDPSLLEIARENIQSWLERNNRGPLDPTLEWKEILDHSSFEEILSWLNREDEEAIRLRQSSPFAGILTDHERSVILKRYEPTRTRTYYSRLV